MANSRKKLVKLPPKNRWFSFIKGIGVYILIGLAALIFFAGLSDKGPSNEIPLSQVVSDIKEKKVEKLELEGDKIVINYKQSLPGESGKEKGKLASSRKESGESIYQVLKNSDIDPKTVAIEIKDISWQNA